MSKTNLFGLLVLGASAIGLVGTTVKLIQKNSELKDLEDDYAHLMNDYDELKHKQHETITELEDVRGDMLEYMAERDERYDKLQENFDKMCSAVDYWQNKYKQQKQENEELKLK